MRIHKVTFFGAGLGFLSLLFSFAALKPNRIVEGEDLLLFTLAERAGGELSGVAAGVSIAAALAAVLLLSAGGEKVRRYGSGILGMMLLLLVFDLLIGAKTLLEEYPYGRITPSSGFWLLLAAFFFIVDSSMRGGGISPWFSIILKVLPALLVLTLLFWGFLDHLAVVMEFNQRSSRFIVELYAHIGLSFAAVSAATLIGVPLGVSAWRKKRMEKTIFSLVNGLQTIPNLALFGLMIAPLSMLSHAFPLLRTWGIKGVGNAPALIALTLYSLLPIVRNTYTALAMIPEAVIDAGVGLGMSKNHVLQYIEVPMAFPIVLGGIRVAAVLTIGNTAVAALIGAGGLGNFVFQGLGQAAPDLIVMGVIPIILLAVFADRMFGLLISVLSPYGTVEEAK